RAGTHLPEARLAQLTACQRERSQPVCLLWHGCRRGCAGRAPATCTPNHPSKAPIVFSALSGNAVSVIANSQSEIPRRNKGQVLRSPVASNEASVVLPVGRSDGPTAKDEGSY